MKWVLNCHPYVECRCFGRQNVWLVVVVGSLCSGIEGCNKRNTFVACQFVISLSEPYLLSV